jgi:hypothetical protein
MNDSHKKIRKEITIIIIVGIVFYLLDIYTASKGHYSKCTDLKNQTVLLCHHIANVFLQFGWLCNTKFMLLLYIMTPVLVVLHWKTNNNRCLFTEYINHSCELSDDTRLRDLWYFVGLKNYKYYNRIQNIYLLIVFVIGIYKIKRLSSNKTIKKI